MQFLSWFPSFILIIARTREHAEDDEQASSSLSSPSSTTSPLTPDDSRAPSAEPATKESEDTSKEPASGPQRTRSSSVQSNGKGADSKEKRKRSRVTPEQLVHLERFFAMDRSPTAARRKEISESLGMQERQTQIWFQNRCVFPFAPYFCLLLNFASGARRRSFRMERTKEEGWWKCRLILRRSFVRVLTLVFIVLSTRTNVCLPFFVNSPTTDHLLPLYPHHQLSPSFHAPTCQ